MEGANVSLSFLNITLGAAAILFLSTPSVILAQHHWSWWSCPCLHKGWIWAHIVSRSRVSVKIWVPLHLSVTKKLSILSCLGILSLILSYAKTLFCQSGSKKKPYSWWKCLWEFCAGKSHALMLCKVSVLVLLPDGVAEACLEHNAL